jgi:hypothetical protein
LDFLKNIFWTIRNKQVDMDWNTESYIYMSKDEKWDYIKKEKPIDDHIEYIRKPARFKEYDDLYLNKKFLDVKLLNDYQTITKHINLEFRKILRQKRIKRKWLFQKKEKNSFRKYKILENE